MDKIDKHINYILAIGYGLYILALFLPAIELRIWMDYETIGGYEVLYASTLYGEVFRNIFSWVNLLFILTNPSILINVIVILSPLLIFKTSNKFLRFVLAATLLYALAIPLIFTKDTIKNYYIGHYCWVGSIILLTLGSFLKSLNTHPIIQPNEHET